MTEDRCEIWPTMIDEDHSWQFLCVATGPWFYGVAVVDCPWTAFMWAAACWVNHCADTEFFPYVPAPVA